MRRVAWRTLAFLLILIVFKILEELIVGWFKDVSFAKTLAEFADKDPVAIIAPILVMTLLLIPLAAFVELERAIGSEQFSRIIRGRD